jgi:eukaryotic-like serine/threonine-protein kinase
MGITAGTRLGPYEITSPIGAGGMGEVWRARDSKLNRDVAIKVLPASLAGDSAYMARFTREAQLLAALNHSNIAAIYGIEESDSTPALVMELVDGQTLAERIQRGPIPLAETVEIARQICNALEAAHAKGIVHRDLKPANIKLTPEGQV